MGEAFATTAVQITNKFMRIK